MALVLTSDLCGYLCIDLYMLIFGQVIHLQQFWANDEDCTSHCISSSCIRLHCIIPIIEDSRPWRATVWRSWRAANTGLVQGSSTARVYRQTFVRISIILKMRQRWVIAGTATVFSVHQQWRREIISRHRRSIRHASSHTVTTFSDDRPTAGKAVFSQLTVTANVTE